MIEVTDTPVAKRVVSKRSISYSVQLTDGRERSTARQEPYWKVIARAA